MRDKSLCAIVALIISFAMFIAPISEAQVVQVAPSAQVRTVTCSAAVGTQTNQTAVTITPKDAGGNPIAGLVFDFYWSDSLAAMGVTATASSGTSGPSIGVLFGVTAATPSVATSRIPMRVQTAAASGTAVITVVDTAKTLFVPAIVIAPNTRPIACTRLTAANYL